MDRPIDHACLGLEVWQEYPETANISAGIVPMGPSVMGLTSILGGRESGFGLVRDTCTKIPYVTIRVAEMASRKGSSFVNDADGL